MGWEMTADLAAAGSKAMMGFVVSLVALVGRWVAEVVPVVPEVGRSLLDQGLAGVVILGLVYALRAVLKDRGAELKRVEERYDERVERLEDLVREKEEARSKIEREVREMLMVDLKKGDETRQELLKVLKRREGGEG